MKESMRNRIDALNMNFKVSSGSGMLMHLYSNTG